MKKIGFFLFAFVIGISFVNANPTATLITNRNSVEVGQSVTATVRVTGTAAWNINIVGSGNTGGCSQRFADASGNAQNVTRTFSVTCRATSRGSIRFVVTGDITAANGVNRTVSANRTISVVPASPVLASNNYLSSLSVGGFTLDNAFDKTVSDYNLTVPPNTTSVNISAAAEHARATVAGTGSVNLSAGLNNIEVVVTAENGSKRTYTIRIIVEEEPIEIRIGEEIFTIIRNKEGLPDVSILFEVDTITIEDKEIAVYRNIRTDMILIGLKDSEGNVALYIYDEEKETFTLFNEHTFSQLILFIFSPSDVTIPRGFISTTLLLNDEEVEAYKNENIEGFYLIYGMNVETGETGLYLYDSEENTIQRYVEGIGDNIREDLYLTIIIALFAILIISYIIFILIISKGNRKRTKIIDNTAKLKKLN